jgi:flagellar hook-associated protein 1 FlgK
MSNLLALLSQGASSLSAHQQALATAGHNLQNAATPGYARQRAELMATVPAELAAGAFIGRGVTMGTVSQARDRFLEQQLPSAIASRARSSAESDSLAALSVLDPSDSSGVPAALGAFYSSMRALSQDPGNSSLRQAAVASSRRLALAFGRSAKAIEAARTGIDASLAGAVDQINDAAASVAALNGQIKIARSSGAEPNDLLDARQRSIDRLAELTGAIPIPNGTGDVTIALPGGGTLVSGNQAAKLSLVGDASNGGHVVLRLSPADGAPAVPLASANVGGRLGGLFDARDGALARAGTALDTVAFDLAGAVNQAHRAGYALDGTTGHDLFDAGPSAAGAAARIAVDAAVLADPKLLAAASSAAGVPGDNSNLLAVIATESTALSGGSNAGDALALITTDFGAEAARAQAVAQQDTSILDNLTNMREATSGVSIDEEMINLSKAQRAFEATMKVITTADDLLDTLLQLR